MHRALPTAPLVRLLASSILAVQVLAGTAVLSHAERHGPDRARPGATLLTAQAIAPTADRGHIAEAPTTPIQPTAVAAAPTTTTTIPTVAPVPQPTPQAVAPVPTPAAVAAPPADPHAQIEAAYASSVPAGWRDAFSVRFELIDGGTSWANTNGTITIGRRHLDRGDAVLRATVAHEFGHLIAFRHGSQDYLGAPPRGWPAYSSRPEEAWADCVSRAFTGLSLPSHGLPPCDGASLSWAADWLASTNPGSS